MTNEKDTTAEETPTPDSAAEEPKKSDSKPVSKSASKPAASAAPRADRQRKKIRVKSRKRKSKSRVWNTRWVRAGLPGEPAPAEDK